MADDQKVSVYIALGAIAAITIADLIQTGTVAASQNISIALLAFAGGRQLLKSTIGK